MSLSLVILLAAVVMPSGESIYRTGASAGGEITATLSSGDVRVAATVVPCASCHGADGRGGSEGGVVSPDIRWQTLSKPYDVTTANARRRKPYTRPLLKRAIAMGIDSSGNRLAPIMPRFDMTAGQMNELIAHLEQLDQTKVPGVGDEVVRVGVVLPPPEPLAGLADAFRSVVTSFFAEASRAGVYGRKIEPVFVEPRGTAEERAAAVREFVREKDVLALAPAFTDGAESALARVADEEKVPLLASITSRPASSSGSHTWVRDLVAGNAEQARMLARFAVERLELRTIAVVAPPDSKSAEAAVAELKALGVSASWANRWPEGGAYSTAIFLGDDALLQKRAANVQTILIPGALATSALLGGKSPGRVFIALPTILRDLTPQGMALWKKVALPASQFRGNQMAALATATLFVHALERAGRDVTRESLLRAVDGVSRLSTGFSPPLTFGPNRHIGSLGAWIVEATAEEPSPVWVEP